MNIALRWTPVALVLLAACDLVGPDWRQTDTTPLEPPLVYARWYAEVETCLGQRGDLSEIRWFTATEIWHDDQSMGGVMRFPAEVTMRTDHVRHPWSVKHEMIHHVLQEGDQLHGGDAMNRCAVLVMP